jgi:hypothetical protein
MYEQYVQRRGAVSQWMLDSNIPYDENTGSGYVGTTKTAANGSHATALVSGAAFSTIFTSSLVGKFSTPLFKKGMESRTFVLEAVMLPIPGSTTGPQQILSHDGIFDGLTINGKVVSFSTIYTTAGSAVCSYDLGIYRRAMVHGIHTYNQNQLWVDGVMVASVDLTDAQMDDTYSASDGFLYTGYTTSTQKLAVNGIGIYPSLDGSSITQNYLASIDVCTQIESARQYDGTPFGMNASQGSVFFDRIWAEKSDFQEGLKNNIEYDAERIVPTYVSGLSVTGTWTVGVPLDAAQDVSIYGVMIEWSGISVTVDYSLDGTTWSSATSGALISAITSGYDPTGKDLQVRVTLGSGLAEDPAELDSLHVLGLRDNNFDNPSTRTITVGYPAVLRGDYEPIMYRDDNGVNLHSQTLTIGTDATTDPQIARTVEIWMKVLSGTPTLSFTGTKYRNGAADSTMPVGEWSLYHVVASADITTALTINGDAVVGQVVIYPTALTAAQVATVYQSYTGHPKTRFNDTGTITLSEPAVPTSIYAHDWSIDAGG